MRLKDFLRPSVGKLILPVIIIVFLLVLFFMSKSVIPFLGEVSCMMVDFNEQSILLGGQNNTGLLDQKALEFSETIEERRSEIGEIKLAFVLFSNQIIGRVDPLYPVPCSILSSGFCGFYISQEGYNCLLTLFSDVKSMDSLFSLGEIKDYRSVSYLALVMNLLLIFIIFYLISCLVAFIYNEMRKKNV
ncbi:MAG: hypothetical protein ABIE22_04225 [archaeon]